MKTAKVRPLFKNGDRQDARNYRPISVLTVFSKISKRLMYNRLISFVKEHNILT
jgi:predicted restriction endonuclease